MRLRIVRIIAAIALVAVAGGSTLAAGGSVYVTSGCDYPKLQDNSIVQGADVWVWLKPTGSGPDGLVAWTVDNPGGITQGPLSLTWDQGECTTFGSKYRLYHLDGFDSSVVGSYTLTMWYSAKDNTVSSDSFRVVPGLN